MKTFTRLSFLLLMAAAVSSCFSTGPSQARRLAASGPDGLRQLISETRAQADTTISSLGALTASTGPAFDKHRVTFLNEAEKMDICAVRLNKIAIDMQKKRGDFFDSWYSSSPSKKSTGTRKAALINVNLGILEKMGQTRDSLIPFVTDLRKITKHLSRDESADGINAVRALAARASLESQDLAKNLQDVEEVLTSLSRAWQEQ